ncbi:hypothetical protein EV196_106134 [Mariniflexile fucanivorans]|uniref:Uncharacterized protein n=1 Tax=Mariniflexile fucanivorans TaxID=264023 RepID=A0A4R1RG39_9FLAO|nr:hypothetical protein [Mariniflexile fucanivorans]TCL64945.1 hypothetical protein EV196_106134 [Mariniflexile fucanivorans]
MKQLKISISLSEYQEKHTIYLGQGEWLKHKSKTFLEAYLRTYKKVLLDNVKILNSYNSQIYTLYRAFFFDLSDIEVERVSNIFAEFNKQFNWMFDNIGGCQNSIIFSKINTCIFISLDILYILQSHAQTHKNYSLKNQAEAYIKMLENFNEKYESEKNSLDVNRNYAQNNMSIIKDDFRKAM